MQDMLKGKANLLPYDAICTFVFADYKAFARFMYDPASKALTGDHDNFMVEEEMKMMVGDEYMVIEDGKTVSWDVVIEVVGLKQDTAWKGMASI
jgi:hypothetical protein